MRIFLDTSLLSDIVLAELSEEMVRRRLLGDEFYISAITHFQVEWGYAVAGKSSERCEAFLRRLNIEVAPLTRLDAERAADQKPSRRNLLDALIAATVMRYEATIWTRDTDFLSLLPKDRTRFLV